MSLLFVFSVGFAQEVYNLEQISWDYSKDTALPALSEGYDGYLVSGSLGNVRNYFVAVSQTQENAQSAYIKFGQLTTTGTAARIYLGGFSSGDSDAYFGNLTADISEAVTLERLYGGVYFENVGHAAYVGDLNTTINADIEVSGLTMGAGQVWNKGATMNVKSSTLTLNGGSYTSNVYGGAHANGGIVNIENGSKLVINSANITTGGDYVVAGGSTAYGDGGVGGSNITGGSSVYLGSGANFSSKKYIIYILGGNFGYMCPTSVTGGSSVTIDGATLDGVKVFGASQSSGVQAGLVSSVDTSKVIVKAGTVNGNIYGGGHSQSHGSTVVTSDASVEMTGGTVTGNIFGGSLYWNANHEDVQATVQGNTSVKITGGTVNGDVFGGSEAQSYQYNGISKAHIGGSTYVEVSGDAYINGSVYGGSLSDVFNSGNGATSNIAGSSNILISGGTIVNNVYGGGYVINEVEGTPTTTTLASSNITVSAGKISGDIYAGGNGAGSSISGDASVAFVGNGADIDFAGTVHGSGGDGATVGGDKTVSFGNAQSTFSGAFNGGFDSIDAISVNANSNVSFAKAFTVEKLLVDSSAVAVLAEGTSFAELGIVFNDDFESGSSFDFDIANIFEDSASVVESILSDAGASLHVINSSGEEFMADYSNGQFSVGAMVPEPSSYAFALGILSIAMATYLRRR